MLNLGSTQPICLPAQRMSATARLLSIQGRSLNYSAATARDASHFALIVSDVSREPSGLQPGGPAM